MRRKSNSSSSGSGGGVGPLMRQSPPRPRCPFVSSATRPTGGPCRGVLWPGGASAARGPRGKATQFGCRGQCAIDWPWPVDLRQRHRCDHLGADARGADRGGTDQPLLSARSNCQEGRLVWRPRPWRAVQRTFRGWSEVSWIMARLPRHRGLPARDLVCAVASNVDDHDLVILMTHPHGLADVVIRNRVLAAFEVDDGHHLAYVSRNTKGSCVRFGRQRVETLTFLGEPFDRRAPRDAVRASIHSLTELITGTPVLDEARVVGQQVGVSRHQVRGGDAHGCF